MTEWQRWSSLPDSPEYWLDLRHRIGAAAQPEIARFRRRDRWVNVGLVTAVSAAAATLMVLLARPVDAPAGAELLMGLAPSDPAALELLRSDEAPSVGELLPSFAGQDTR